jgi:hypothetical protein
MTSFETFWTDKRIPKRMKRCGPAPVRAAIKKRNLDDEGLEHLLDSFAGYERHKPDYADYCMLSTYINQERDMVEWNDMDEAPASAEDQTRKLREMRVKGYQKNGYWHPGWGPEPRDNVVSMKG